MNTRNRITLLLAAIMVVALLVVGMTLTASAADGDLVTEYGTVPAANANENFAIFQKAPGATEYTFVASASNPFTYNSAAYQKLEGDVVMLMLKDTDYTNMATVGLTPCANASLTIDLGGRKLIGSKNGTGTFNIYGIALSKDTVTNITIKNGTFEVGSREAILIGHTEAELGYNLEQNLTLDHVNFTKQAGANYIQAFVQVNTKPVSPSTFNILYNECVLDLRGIAEKTTVYPICSDRATGKQVVNSVFKGGEIIVDYMENMYLINGRNVTFAKGENGYFKFSALKGENVNYSSLTYDAPNVAFTTLAQDDTRDYYQAVSLETPYGLIGAANASLKDYPFAMFKKPTGSDEWTFFAYRSGYTDPFVDNQFTQYWNFDGEMVFFMRRDVDWSDRAAYPNGFRMRPKATIDLNGHTLIGSNVGEATFYFATKSLQNGTNARNFIFKNGTIITKDKPFVLFNPQATTSGDAANDPTINITFDNVTLKRAEGATKEQPFIQLNFMHEGFAFKTNITYNDCTFDIRGEFNNPDSPFMYLFTIASGSSKYDYPSLLAATQTVNGGKILADTTNNLRMILNGRNNGSKVSFEEGSDGKMTQLVLPNGVENTLTSNTNNLVYNAETLPLAFKQASKDSENTTYTLVPYWLTQYTPKTSVTLSSDLVYNIYLPTSRFMSATLNGVDVSELGATKVTLSDGETYYHVAVSAGLLGAGDAVELKTTINGGGNIPVTATRTLNVVKYAKSLLSTTESEVQTTLVKDMLAYVKAACVYAGEKAETVTAINAIIGEDYTVAAAEGEAVEKTEGLAGAALLLGDKPAFVFYTDGSYDASAYKFEIGTTTVTTEITEIDGKEAIVVYTYAYAMTNTVTYTIEGTEISGAYNLAAYLAHEKAANNTNTVALVEALWQYSDAAKAYKAEQAA